MFFKEKPILRKSDRQTTKNQSQRETTPLKEQPVIFDKRVQQDFMDLHLKLFTKINEEFKKHDEGENIITQLFEVEVTSQKYCSKCEYYDCQRNAANYLPMYLVESATPFDDEIQIQLENLLLKASKGNFNSNLLYRCDSK